MARRIEVDGFAGVTYADIQRLMIYAGVLAAASILGYLVSYCQAIQVSAAVANGQSDLSAPRWLGLSWLTLQFVRLAAFVLIVAVVELAVFCAILGLVFLLLISIPPMGILAGIIALPLLIVGVLLFWFVSSVMVARLAVTNSLADAVDAGYAIRSLRASPVDWLVAIVLPVAVSVGLGVGLQFTGPLSRHAPWLAALVQAAANAYVVLVAVHLLGQAYNLSARKLAYARFARDGWFIPSS